MAAGEAKTAAEGEKGARGEKGAPRPGGGAEAGLVGVGDRREDHGRKVVR